MSVMKTNISKFIIGRAFITHRADNSWAGLVRMGVNQLV